MKALIVLVILFTFASIFFQFYRSKDWKKLFASLLVVSFVIALGIMGNLTRQIMPLFLVHIVLVLFAWIGILWYIVRDKFYWWIIFSPVVSLVAFLLLEFLTGSSHNGVLPL